MALAPLAGAADRIYWSNDDSDSIARANLNGTGGSLLNTGNAVKAAPNGLAIDSSTGKIYWANYGANNCRSTDSCQDGGGTTISYANLDGSGGFGNLSIGSNVVSSPHGVAFDPTTRRIYWVNFSDNDVGGHGGEIHYATLDASGTGVSNIRELNLNGATAAGMRSLAIDPAGGRIYWANHSAGSISYAELNGSGGGNVNTFGATPPHNPEGVAIDPVTNRIYWSDFDDPANISWANLNGSGGDDLNTSGATLFYAHGLAIDPEARRVYWANFFDHIPPPPDQSISSASLNGDGGSNLPVSGGTLAGPDLPVILKAPAGAGAPTVSGGSGVGDTLSCTQGAWAPDMVSSLFYRAPQGVSYQWSRDGTDIGGASSSSYTPSSGGDYRCTVTARNAAGTGQQTSSGHTIVGDGSDGGSSKGGAGGSNSGAPVGSHSGKVYSCHGKTVTLRAATSSKHGTVRGTRRRDVIMGTSGDDVLVGGKGNDIICGRGGDDTLKGGSGNDKLIGGGGRDVLLGRRGRDLLVGGPEHDVCLGGPGIDSRRRC